MFSRCVCSPLCSLTDFVCIVTGKCPSDPGNRGTRSSGPWDSMSTSAIVNLSTHCCSSGGLPSLAVVERNTCVVDKDLLELPDDFASQTRMHTGRGRRRGNATAPQEAMCVKIPERAGS